MPIAIRLSGVLRRLSASCATPNRFQATPSAAKIEVRRASSGAGVEAMGSSAVCAFMGSFRLLG
jgi:hypothetical protein